MDARDAEVRAIATQALEKAKHVAELRKPLADWAMKVWWLPAIFSISFYRDSLKYPDGLGQMIVPACFIATMVCFEVAIRRQQKRIEALTFLLLEQQEGLNRDTSQ